MRRPTDPVELARSLQAENYFARKAYIVALAFLLVTSVYLFIQNQWTAIVTTVGVAVLVFLIIINERLIRSFRKAGIK